MPSRPEIAMRYQSLVPVLVASVVLVGCSEQPTDVVAPEPTFDLAGSDGLDGELRPVLAAHGFTGGISLQLEARLGRGLDSRLADVGRLIFFDRITGLNGDNSCSGCHGPQASFGDAQSIAIGIDNNGIVGPDRRGPRNQRRSPSVINTAFYPALMWNSRFSALSGDPFDNSAGFLFPPPEGLTLSHMRHLLGAQAHIPFTERVEMAGFAFPGDNDAIRAEVLQRLNAIRGYRTRFGQIYPTVRVGGPITFQHVGEAIAEFTFSLVRADAPIDRYARGEAGALSESQKRGALLFFGRAGCVGCHAVAGESNEMFSDFQQHVLGVPQVAPEGGNVVFDGPGADEDFGLEQITGDVGDRYAFRSSPLRNVGLQPTFMHNGAFVRLDDAIRHHLDVRESVRRYTTAPLDPDLQGPLGPIAPVLARLDPLVRAPLRLSDAEFLWLMDFVGNALTDSGASPERLRDLVPNALPSGEPVHVFQFERP
jgi:cytochrome c peroxidase